MTVNDIFGSVFIVTVIAAVINCELPEKLTLDDFQV